MDLDLSSVMLLRSKVADRLHEKVFIEAIIGALAMICASVVTFTMASPKVVVAWLLVGAIFYLTRFGAGFIYFKVTPQPQSISMWFGGFIFGTMASGLCWGFFAAYVVVIAPTLQTGIVLFLCVIVTLICVLTQASSLLVTIVSTLTILVPPLAALLTNSGPFNIWLAGMLGTMTLFCAFAAWVMSSQLRDKLLLDAEKEQLVDHLDQRRNQVEKLNVALKTNNDKRQQAETKLRRTAADYGLVQGKARALAETLERISPICQMTGLANRRALDEAMDIEWRRATRQKQPISILVASIDQFDEYIEAHGNQQSDVMLRRIGQMVKGFGRRAGDVAGRWADSKIGLLLPNADARNSARMAEALRKRVVSQKMAHITAANRQYLSIHVGVATMIPSNALNSEELVKRVEASLYEAKFQGGNKVVIHKPLSRLKLERWENVNDGPLNEQSLIQKLLVWGYDTTKQMMKAGATLEDQVSPHEMVISLLTGEVRLNVEGHLMSIQAGDTLIIPPGVTHTLEVTSRTPVIKFTATKQV